MRFITVFIAMISGLAILAGYFLKDFFPVLGVIQVQLLNAAVTLVGVAALAGISNLVSVHAGKARRDKKNGIYSALLVVSLFVTFGLGLVLGSGHAVMQVVVKSVILPVEAALMGILTVSLLYAAIRLLRRRVDMTSIIFLITAVFVLLGSATLPYIQIPLLGDVSRWVTQVLALGGMRGILIGVALGSFVTGLRVLFGADRPYGG
jgi:cytochrome bd-type quinol oxidase subunit 2